MGAMRPITPADRSPIKIEYSTKVAPRESSRIRLANGRMLAKALICRETVIAISLGPYAESLVPRKTSTLPPLP